MYPGITMSEAHISMQQQLDQKPLGAKTMDYLY
jgi:hypothetical protein